MNDAEDVTHKLAELLRHPDDLDKIASLRSEFTRKKAAVDSQLRLGLKEQLEITQTGMNSISEGQRTVNLIKEEMMKIDKLCAEAQNMIKDFPFVNKIAQTHRNFAQVEEMKGHIDAFGQSLDDLERILEEDDQDLENQNNLLAIHYGLTRLRDVRDQALDQITSSEDSSLELINNLQLDGGATLQDHFARLDQVVDWFDSHVGTACMNLIPLVQSGNNGMVVRLALIVEEEEKKDKQVKAMQDAQRDFKDVASRFKSMKTGPKELRGYKEKFLKAIELNAQSQFEISGQAFLEDSDKLEKSVRWYFNDLNTVKLGMVGLMPKKWRIFKTYVSIYHRLMHDFLTSRVQDPELNSQHMLAIIHWVSKYYSKMKKLGIPEDQLQPHVVDGREAELVHDYRSLIVKAVDEWMDRMSTKDRQTFLERKEGSIDTDHNNCFRTKTLGDMWDMLRQQLSVAQSSDRADVVEGVIDAMLRTLMSRQKMWQKLVDSETAAYNDAAMAQQPQTEEPPLLDWLIAVANDQIACIDDETQPSYVSRFRDDYAPLVTPAYATSSLTEIETLRDGYGDLSIHCISLFASLIFTDCRSILTEFFTPGWYSSQGMGQIIATLKDYLEDYEAVVHHSLADVMVEELADGLLERYLSSVRNKGVKFRRNDLGNFTDKIRDDVVKVFEFFRSYENSFPTIREKWRAVNLFVELLSAEKGQAVTDAYARFKEEYWDVQIGWVEAVLRSRDDFDRSMIGAVRAKAAEMTVERGMETVMGKVR